MMEEKFLSDVSEEEEEGMMIM